MTTVSNGLWRWLRCVSAMVVVLLSTQAANADDALELESELERGLNQLNQQDCASACSALASLERLVERICQLEPGPRCVDARERLAAAQQRVWRSCTDCDTQASRHKAAETLTQPSKKPPVPRDTESQPSKKPSVSRDAEPQPLPAAPGADEAELASRGGGCAACTVAGPSSEAPPAWLWLGLAWMWWRRRRGRAGVR